MIYKWNLNILNRSSKVTIETKKVVTELFNLILEIPGDKIVTLIISGSEPFVIDINKGSVGHSPGHKVLFLLKLAEAFQKGAGMIIREFLHLKVKQRMPNGEDQWIPEKNLYGVYLKGQEWIGFEADAVKECQETDYHTRRPIPTENGVHYKKFPFYQ